MFKFKEIYFSVDIESTGPIPGDYSMSSFGAFAAGGRLENGDYVRFDHKDEANKFYIELKPISENFTTEAIKIGLLEGFDESQEDETGEKRHAWMKEHGKDPATAMNDFASWIEKVSSKHNARPIFVAYPAPFDWMFIYWYFRHFNVESPFGFSGARDMKEIYATKSGAFWAKSTKRSIPKHLLKTDIAHTHHALDDAIGQGHFFMNLMEWTP